MHRSGASIRELIKESSEGRHEHGVRIKWARLESQVPVRWNRCESSGIALTAEAHCMQNESPQYTERKLTCPKCQTLRETRHMQLRTTYGFRPVQCLGCHVQQWTGKLLCTCGVRWHQCEVHRIDPVQHRVMKRPARKVSHTHDVLLPSNRPAPDNFCDNPRALKRRRVELVERVVRLNSSICPHLAARFPHLVGAARGEGVG
jgi:hypothetical protein